MFQRPQLLVFGEISNPPPTPDYSKPLDYSVLESIGTRNSWMLLKRKHNIFNNHNTNNDKCDNDTNVVNDNNDSDESNNNSGNNDNSNNTNKNDNNNDDNNINFLKHNEFIYYFQTS